MHPQDLFSPRESAEPLDVFILWLGSCSKLDRDSESLPTLYNDNFQLESFWEMNLRRTLSIVCSMERGSLLRKYVLTTTLSSFSKEGCPISLVSNCLKTQESLFWWSLDSGTYVRVWRATSALRRELTLSYRVGADSQTKRGNDEA